MGKLQQGRIIVWKKEQHKHFATEYQGVNKDKLRHNKSETTYKHTQLTSNSLAATINQLLMIDKN